MPVYRIPCHRSHINGKRFLKSSLASRWQDKQDLRLATLLNELQMAVQTPVPKERCLNVR